MVPLSPTDRLPKRALYALCGLLLIAFTINSCGEGDKSKVSERDAVDTSAEDSRKAKHSDGDISFNSDVSTDEDDSVFVSESEDSEPVVGSVVAEDGQGVVSAVELHRDPLLGEIEQETDESIADAIEPDTSGTYHSAQENPDVVWEIGAIALDDRTQDKTVKLVLDSITLNDCVMRGEIHNHSNDLYARHVTVTVAALDSENSVEWHWPLTIMPGETAPFEVEINWFPHVYNHDNPAGSMQYLLNAENWEVFRNTSFDITAELSLVPDVGRAFTVNADRTEHIALYQNRTHKFLVYDERALESEMSEDWYQYGREYSPKTRASFDLTFPEGMIRSKDIEPIVSKFNLYQFTDIYYTPSWLYPEVYVEGVHDLVSNVRVYQAYKSGTRIVDVWELIPHLVSEQVDSQGLLIDRQFIPKSDFTSYSLSPGEEAYIQLLEPYYDYSDFPNRSSERILPVNYPEHIGGGEYLSALDRSQFDLYPLWLGAVSHSSVSSNSGPLKELATAANHTCFASGALRKGDFYLVGQTPYQRVRDLGFYGKLSYYDHDNSVGNGIMIEQDSLTSNGDTIRGLVYNESNDSYAVDVKVHAIDTETNLLMGEWLWPLSIQPGEHAPFEIQHSTSNFDLEKIEFQITAILSETVDSTRSFLIDFYSGGRVYGEQFMDLYDYRPYDSEYYKIEAEHYLDRRAMSNSGRRSRFTKDEFLKIYDGVMSAEDIEELELFGFGDLYARLQAPDSHPELAKIVMTQYIEHLRAFVAILDDDERVVEVNELTPFTPVYGHSNVDKTYVTVDRIPAPNLWSPNAVRLLVTIPYEDEADMEAGYGYQVWIGGASEPVG